MKRILYITYDGLTDPLGQSQILPYLIGLSKMGYKFTILSFEKKHRYEKNRSIITALVEKADIDWVPLRFTSQPPLLAKFYDVIRMKKKAFQLHRKENFDMIHCRSYIAADVGLQMKKEFGTKFFFDMRGFWADEKKDGGAWNLTHPVYKQVYKYYKRKEASYLQQADYIISLTKAGKKEMKKWPSYNQEVPVAVIPCCADMEHFSLTSPSQKKEGRERLGINQDRFILSYLGSIGSWYMIDEMFLFFVSLKRKYPTALFLIVSHSDKNFILEKAFSYSIKPEDIYITEASREEVPVFIKASDINISFIKPVFSKLSSSPTKLGEVLSMGIPVIVNAGVGDVEEIVQETNSGIVLKEFTVAAFGNAVDAIPLALAVDSLLIREKATQLFDLTVGIDLYIQAYKEVLR